MKQNDIYKVLKYFNDMKALKNGKLGKRILRRAIGKVVGRFMNKIIGR